MIMRFQSFCLALVALIAILLCFIPVAQFQMSDGNMLFIRFGDVYRISTAETEQLIEQGLLLKVDILIIIIFSIISFGLFKKRKIQLSFSIALLSAILILIVILFYQISRISQFYTAQFKPGFEILLPVIIAILVILAIRGIRKDEKLLSSYNRLR